MIVSDLIAKLKTMPQDSSVYIDLEENTEHWFTTQLRVVNVWERFDCVILETK
jgi:hypothetical protein